MIEIRNRKTSRLLYRTCTDTLEGADLRGTHLFRADLAGANLRGADLSGADLREANLAGADLTGAVARHARLSQADLTGARLERVNLRGADFWRTKLLHTDLATADLTGAWYARTQRWPPGFDPVAAGAWLEGLDRSEVTALYLETLGDQPRRLIHWRSEHLCFVFDETFSRSADFERIGIRFCPPFADWLEVGPQHVDLEVQAQLRTRYFDKSENQDTARRDQKCVDHYAQALSGGETVLFWCGPRFGSCLGTLWALDALHQRGADLHNAFLLLWPTTPGESPSEPEVRLAFEQLVPVCEVLEPLIAVRRHLASDGDTVAADLSELPPRVRDWVAVTDNLMDYLPDERGLDIPDMHLLNLMTEEWQSGRELNSRFPRPREPGWGVLWNDRLLELCGSGSYGGEGRADPEWLPAQARFHKDGGMWESRFRITSFGSKVRAGEEDLLARSQFSRWIGGRLVTKERPLRRPPRPSRILDR